jgi:hypothetical protein
MKKTALSQTSLPSEQEVVPKKTRWKRRASLVLAFVTPDLPQILRRKEHLVGSLLFFFGTGLLISMIMMGISLLIRDDIRGFDYLYIIFRPQLLAVYPTSINSSAPSADTLLPILSPDEPTHIQPFFQELLYFHIIGYLLCAVISFWEQWKLSNRGQSSS